MSDWWNQPTRPTVEPQTSAAEALPSCPWCAEPALPDASNCSNCGAVMTQRDDLGGLAIPGVTVVDPAMQASSSTSSLIRSQSRMSTLSMIGSAPGGTVLQVVAAAAMLAGDSARGSGGTVKPDDIGKPSQAALDMAERLRRPTVPAASPNPVEPSTADRRTGGEGS
jgi:hypothetical protein